MREAALVRRLLVTVAGATIFVWLAGCSVEAGGESAAHDLAEQFAKEARKSKEQARQRAGGDAQPPRPTVEDRRKSEEAEMLARARQEAEQRRAEMLKAREEAERADALRQAEAARAREEKRRKNEDAAEEARRQAEIARQAEEERRLAEAQRKAEGEVKAAEAARKAEEERWLAEAARKAEEERQLAEARRRAEEQAKAEEARRQAEAARKAEEERRMAEARRVAEEERRLAEARRIAEEQARAEDERRREAAEQARRERLHAEREAEGERLADRLRQAREQRRWRVEEPASSTAEIAPARPEQGAAGLGGEPWRRADRSDRTEVDTPSPFGGSRNVERVTVLLVIQPGNYGIRRHNKTGDPILCSMSGCYVSGGADAAAEFLPGRRALKFGRIFGDRAGACSNSLGCVFRDIDLRSIGQFLAPVDMHVLKHDRRQAQHNVSASDCRVEGARLSCRRGIRAADYVMWIVPEYVAEQAGPEILEQAVDDGLVDAERVGLAGSASR